MVSRPVRHWHYANGTANVKITELLSENMDHSKDDQAVPQLRAALLGAKAKILADRKSVV